MHSYGGAFAWKHLLVFMHTAQCLFHHYATGPWEGCVPYPQNGACDVTLMASIIMEFQLFKSS